MAVISKETWDKFTKEEKKEIKRLYSDDEICYTKFMVWHLLAELFGKDTLTLEDTDTDKDTLSKEKQDKIIEYCRNKLYEVKEYLSLAKSFEDMNNIMKNFEGAYINDVEHLNHNVANFSLVYDNIMIFGYVTPCGVALDTNVSYNNGSDIYEVDINARTIS